jgi:DNA-binding transcriptional MerR regulator
MKIGSNEKSDLRRKGKSPSAFRTISEVSENLEIPAHVLRFWETKFLQIKPLKRGGGRRYYRPEDVSLLKTIRGLLYNEGYTIKGVQRLLRDGTLKSTVAVVEKIGKTDVPKNSGIALPNQEANRNELQQILEDLKTLKRLLTAS